jgi:hypothetical protein
MRISAVGGSAGVVAAICLLVGCGSGAPAGWGGRIVSWSHTEAGKQPVPGIDSASVKFGTYGEGFAPIFWSDDPGGGLGAHWDATRKQVHYQGELYAVDSRTIRIECFTSDGKTGTVLINGQEYRLETGPLFLIKTSGREIVVRPIARDPAMLRADSQELQQLAASDADIKAFFAGER